jgi:hypothetical protein
LASIIVLHQGMYPANRRATPRFAFAIPITEVRKYKVMPWQRMAAMRSEMFCTSLDYPAGMWD